MRSVRRRLNLLEPNNDEPLIHADGTIVDETKLYLNIRDNYIMFPGRFTPRWASVILDTKLDAELSLGLDAATKIGEFMVEHVTLAVTKIQKWWKQFPKYRKVIHWIEARTFVRRVRTELRHLYIYIGMTDRNTRFFTDPWHSFHWNPLIFCEDYKNHVRRLFQLIFIHDKRVQFWNNSITRIRRGWRKFSVIEGEETLAINERDNLWRLAMQCNVLRMQRANLFLITLPEEMYFQEEE